MLLFQGGFTSSYEIQRKHSRWFLIWINVAGDGVCHITTLPN